MQLSFISADPNFAVRIRLDYARPPLIGSEKQVAWAKDVRAAFERQVCEFFESNLSWGEAIYQDDLSNEFIIAQMAKARAAMAKATETSRIDEVFANDSARFWIDSRHSYWKTLLAPEPPSNQTTPSSSP